MLVAGTFDWGALDVLRSAEVDYLLFNLVEVIFIHAKSLHDYLSFMLSALTELPGDDSESDSMVLKHVQDPIEYFLVKQVADQLKREALHSNAT